MNNPFIRIKKQFRGARIRWNESKQLREKLLKRYSSMRFTKIPSTLYFFLDNYKAHHQCGANIEEYALMHLYEKKSYVRRNTLDQKALR